MTIRTGTDYQGHASKMQRKARMPAPPPTVKMVKRTGIKRDPTRQRTAKNMDLSDRHLAVLRLVGDEPTAPRSIATALGISRDSVGSALYALQDRELVQRIPWVGWVRT